MSLTTLKNLEGMAEREFEERADRWVRAIAEREGVGFDELRPHLVSLHCEPGYRLEAVFIFPGHTPVKFFSDYVAHADARRHVAKLEKGKLVGNDYRWYAFRTNCAGSVSFHGIDNLGEALLLAHWAYEEDERAKWHSNLFEQN